MLLRPSKQAQQTQDLGARCPNPRLNYSDRRAVALDFHDLAGLFNAIENAQAFIGQFRRSCLKLLAPPALPRVIKDVLVEEDDEEQQKLNLGQLVNRTSRWSRRTDFSHIFRSPWYL
jgi:hypothetical protein